MAFLSMPAWGEGGWVTCNAMEDMQRNGMEDMQRNGMEWKTPPHSGGGAYHVSDDAPASMSNMALRNLSERAMAPFWALL